MTSCFVPEGRLLTTPDNARACADVDALRHAMERGTILEGTALLCDENHDLLVRVGPFTGRIPRREAALGIAEGTTRDIAILARVGKPVCFTITDITEDSGEVSLLLSRRQAQERALEYILSHWEPGQVVPATVTHLEPFGAFVDIGCGVPSMIGVERLSVSRIPHADRRVRVGQEIYAAVLSLHPQDRRVVLTHKELLGTWEQNAALFRPGMTLTGYIRGVKEYGAFVELTPNLSGLAEAREDVREGDRVSVYLKSILPQRMKLKLLILEVLPPLPAPEQPRYFIKEGFLRRWQYAPEGCAKAGSCTVFGV